MSDFKITETLQNYYDKIFEDGKLVNVHIGMWGMSYNLTEEDIKLNNKLPDTIKLGKKMLIKPEVYNKFKRLEQKIRNYLYTNSFNFPLVGQAHFVTKAKFVDVYKELNKLRGEYMQMVEEFIEKYEDYKKEALAYYQEHKDTVDIDDLETAYPALNTIRKKFYMDIMAYEISLPTQFSEVDIHDAIDREKTSKEVRQETQQQYQEEYQRQIATHSSKIKSFMDDATSTLRQYVVDFCSTSLSKIEKKEVVSQSNIRTLLEKVQEFRAMNFVNDRTVEEKLSQVEAFLNSDKNFEKDKDAISALRGYLGEAVETAKKLTDVVNVSGEYLRKLKV